jgi:hypothetical protein
MRLHVWGAPAFEPGERALLFLTPRRDGTWGALHLAAGVFHERREVSGSLAVRDLAEVQVLEGDGGPAVERGRDFDRFSRWLGDRAAGVRRPADYLVDAPAGPRAIHEKFTYLADIQQRWTEFDAGQDVDWRSHVDGQPGQSDGGVGPFQSAIGAWNNDAATNIRYRYRGTTSASAGFSGFDDLNVILFEDPHDDASNSFVCPTPGQGFGVLAVGGTWTAGGAEPVKIHGGDIVINDGAGCWFSTAKRAEQVYGHELGHTLGLGHSCGGGDPCNAVEDEALMRATAHADNRGAALNSDDRAGILTLYPGGSGKPTAPSGLTALVQSSSAILLGWNDNSTNETSFRIDRKIGNGAYSQLTTVAADTSSFQVLSLDPGTLYTFRVRAQNGSGNSAFSNEASGTTFAAGPPAAPSQLTAALGVEDAIVLAWQDNSTNETGFLIEQSSPTTGWQLLTTLSEDVEAATFTGAPADTPHSFRVRALGDSGASAFSNVANLTTAGGATGPCVPGAGNLCLGAGGRFRIEADWRANGSSGPGGAAPLDDGSGTFWFFDPSNIELIVKALDGGGVNGKFWIFYGALSDVEYWVTVTDTMTGARKTYHNEHGSLCGVGDTGAFPSPSVGAIAVDAAALLTPVAEAAAGPCAEGTLCLLGGRFEVTTNWIALGTSGEGTPVPLSSDQSGLFWFFQPSNIELVVKALDGQPVNGKYWIFYGALSDVEYEIDVRDTVTGVVKTYHNAQGNLCGLGDTDAFDP